MPKAKWCWVATQTKKGWRLALAVGPKNYNLSGLLLASQKDVERVATKGGIVFIQLKDQLLTSKKRK